MFDKSKHTQLYGPLSRALGYLYININIYIYIYIYILLLLLLLLLFQAFADLRLRSGM